MARKNQIANGSAAQMPSVPNGRNADAPAADSLTGMLVRLAGSNRPTEAMANTTRPTSAMAVMMNMVLRASPAPVRWIATKIANTARYTHQPSVIPKSCSDST